MMNFDVNFLLPLLALLTLLGVAVIALIGKERVERRRKNPDAPKSTLAKDAPDHR